jgi:hypothetical protein
MNKLPVGDIVASSFRFLFGRIGTVLAITWLPAVLYAGADSATHLYFAAHRTAVESQDPQAQGLYFLVLAAGFVVSIYARAASAVGIVREVFGSRVQGGIHFPYDRTAWRMFAASIRFWIGSAALIALAFAVGALGLLLAGISPNTAGPVPLTPASLLAILIGWVAVFYAIATMLRMGFLLPAVVVAEEKGGLQRSYDLTKANLWRIIALAVVLVLPTFLLLIAGETAVLGAAGMPQDPEKGDFFSLMTRAEEAIDRQLVPWEIFNAIVFILYSGLTYSGVAYAYRALAGKNEKQTVQVF